MSSSGRLMKEFRDLQRHGYAQPGKELLLRPVDDNLGKWEAHVIGPEDTPYAGGVFNLSIRIPSAYPLVSPEVRFVTKIFHANIHFKTGEICLDILKNAWTPAWTLETVLRAVIALLSHPEADSPLNCDAGNLLRSGDLRGHDSMAKMYTELCAKPTS